MALIALLVVVSHVIAALITVAITRANRGMLVFKTPTIHRHITTTRTFRGVTTKNALLTAIMLCVGCGTLYAAANTYEVLTRHNLPVVSVVKPVKLTNNPTYQEQLLSAYSAHYKAGEFGVPASITYPETGKTVDIVTAVTQHNQWLANNNLAQEFLAKQPIQKVFGLSVVYMRQGTLTIRDLGSVMQGDLIRVKTTKGWNLDYTVSEVSQHPSSLHITNSASVIEVIMVNNTSGAISCFTGSLQNVGGRD